MNLLIISEFETTGTDFTKYFILGFILFYTIGYSIYSVYLLIKRIERRKKENEKS